MLRVGITRIRGLEESLLGIRMAVLNGRSSFVDQIGAQMLAYAKDNHPWQSRTGRLANSTKLTPGAYLRTGHVYRVFVGVMNPVTYYAGYVEFRYDRLDRWSWIAPASRAVLAGSWAWTQLGWDMARAFSTYAPGVRTSGWNSMTSFSPFAHLPESIEYREHPGP